MSAKARVGVGFDAHRLVAGRRLVLGGVEIPFEKGLRGWSDADVLTHAVMDALLGAAALGDIGVYFPPGEAEFEDISSIVLLGRVRDELKKRSWNIINVDATVVAERPRLREHIEAMCARISETLAIDRERVGLKASTSDGLGYTGRGEGIAAYAVALLESS